MCLIKDDDAVASEPSLNLVQPLRAVLRRRDKRPIRAENDAAPQTDLARCRIFVDLCEWDISPKIIQVTARGLKQIIVNGEPEGTASVLKPIVENDGGKDPSFADSGAVSHIETSASSVRQSLLVALAGINHALQLDNGEFALFDNFDGEAGPVCDVRRSDRRHGRRFHNYGGVR